MVEETSSHQDRVPTVAVVDLERNRRPISVQREHSYLNPTGRFPTAWPPVTAPVAELHPPKTISIENERSLRLSFLAELENGPTRHDWKSTHPTISEYIRLARELSRLGNVVGTEYWCKEASKYAETRSILLTTAQVRLLERLPIDARITGVSMSLDEAYKGALRGDSPSTDFWCVEARRYANEAEIELTTGQLDSLASLPQMAKEYEVIRYFDRAHAAARVGDFRGADFYCDEAESLTRELGRNFTQQQVEKIELIKIEACCSGVNVLLQHAHDEMAKGRSEFSEYSCDLCESLARKALATDLSIFDLRRLLSAFQNELRNFDNPIICSVQRRTSLGGVETAILEKLQEKLRQRTDQRNLEFSALPEMLQVAITLECAQYVAKNATNGTIRRLGRTISGLTLNSVTVGNAFTQLLDAWADCPYLQDIFESPCSSRYTIKAPLLSEHVVGIARNIHDENVVKSFIILADALQDAGCEDDALLSYCRNPEISKSRFSWVIRSILKLHDSLASV